MENKERFTDDNILCRFHYVVIFLNGGTIELADRVLIADRVDAVFKNLVSAATAVGEPDEWCLYEEITFTDGIVQRCPLVSGIFENFVNDESYSIKVDM